MNKLVRINISNLSFRRHLAFLVQNTREFNKDACSGIPKHCRATTIRVREPREGSTQWRMVTQCVCVCVSLCASAITEKVMDSLIQKSVELMASGQGQSDKTSVEFG